nr:MAG TPA: hypothetical protein [Caudoviricetes sp.]
MKLSGKKEAPLKTNLISIQILNETVWGCCMMSILCFTMV